jgi:hypothetical protein
VVLAYSVALAFRGEIAGSTLVVLAFSVAALGAEVALAAGDVAVSHGEDRKGGYAGKNGD